MMRLKSKLLSLNADKAVKVKVYSPRNCEEVRIPFRADKLAKVVGKLATLPPPSHNSSDHQSQLITGVLVQNDFKMSLMAPEDLREYAGLTTTTIVCKQRLTLSAAGVELIRWALEGTFGHIEVLSESKASNGDTHMNGSSEEADEEISSASTAYQVMGCVIVRHHHSGEVELEWEANMLNDGIADAIMAVLFSVESSPAAVKRTSLTYSPLLQCTTDNMPESSSKHSHSHSHSHSYDLPTRNLHANLSPTERLERLFLFLEAQFGADNISPISIPRLSKTQTVKTLKSEQAAEETSDASEDEEREIEELQRQEIERLHNIGIPVPGVEIKVDKSVAKVWLEDLEVECANRILEDRVRRVVERAVEVTAPLFER